MYQICRHYSDTQIVCLFFWLPPFPPNFTLSFLFSPLNPTSLSPLSASGCFSQERLFSAPFTVEGRRRREGRDAGVLSADKALVQICTDTMTNDLECPSVIKIKNLITIIIVIITFHSKAAGGSEAIGWFTAHDLWSYWCLVH